MFENEGSSPIRGTPLFFWKVGESVPEVKIEDLCTFCKQHFHDECDSFWVMVNDSGTAFEWVSCCCGGNFDSYTYLKEEELASYSKAGEWNYVGPLVDDEPIDTYIEGFGGSKSPDSYADPLSSGRKWLPRLPRLSLVQCASGRGCCRLVVGWSLSWGVLVVQRRTAIMGLTRTR